MATKKCPKCGEENPAEAVMCWACYTPLAGGAAAVAGGGLVTPRGGAAAVTPAGTAAAADEEKKAVDPKIFLVVGLLLVAGVIGGFTTGIFGGSSNGDTVPTELPEAPTGSVGPGGGAPQPGPQPPVQAPITGGGGGGGGTTQPPVAAHFKTVVPPDPRYSNGTMAIIPTEPSLSSAQAVGLAKYAKQMFAPGGRWKSMQVIVFSDPVAAKTFQKYQAQRKGAKLTTDDYSALASQGVWSGAPAYLETQGKSEQPYQPSANPNGWWTSRGR